MVVIKSSGIPKTTLRVCMVLLLCLPLILMVEGDQGKGNKGRKDSSCETVTANAMFRDGDTDGIRSEEAGVSKYYDDLYYGIEDALVCLLTEQDHDFIFSVQGGTKYEKASGLDRRVTLDFTNNGNDLNLLPFNPTLEVDVLIRVDEVLSAADYTDTEMRFLLWLDVGRNSYQLRFDGLDPCEYVKVTQETDPSTKLRVWTIESIGSHTARLEKVKGKRYTVGHFVMPFSITVYETDKEPTCL